MRLILLFTVIRLRSFKEGSVLNTLPSDVNRGQALFEKKYILEVTVPQCFLLMQISPRFHRKFRVHVCGDWCVYVLFFFCFFFGLFFVVVVFFFGGGR